MHFLKAESWQLKIAIGLTVIMFGVPGVIGLLRALAGLASDFLFSLSLLLITGIMLLCAVGLILIKRWAYWLSITFFGVAICASILSVLLKLLNGSLPFAQLGLPSSSNAIMQALYLAVLFYVFYKNKSEFQ
jgi:hypothetical protein